MAIEVKDKLATIVEDSCNFCGACVSACRFRAISIEVDKQPVEDLGKYLGCGVRRAAGRPRGPGRFRAIHIGRKLADDRNRSLQL